MKLDQPLHGVAVYNPGLLSKDELIRLFVARTPLLGRLLDDIRREGNGGVQHHLLIGRRGMGKTTLLRRLAHAIDDDTALTAIWLPLTFPEEQYNVGHLSDFWLNCLDALGDRLERRGDTDHASRLDADIARITDLTPEAARQTAALALLEAMARRLDRRFVLLIDNVDLILDRIKTDEWALRSALSNAPWLLLIGASSVGVESTYKYEAAFYDFFRVHHLKALDDTETFDLLRNLAAAYKSDAVARLLDTDAGRIRAIRVLAGGNPRTLVLLFSLLSQGIDGNVRTDLERLLDHCTPLYKSRFEAMPPQQQQIVDAMAVHWHPITAGDLAARLRMDVNSVSSQLHRLERDGVIEKVEIYESRRAGFQVAERFFNIWYLMRTSRRVRRHLLWLVEFLRLMYSPAALSGIARRHLDGETHVEGDEKLHHAEAALALAAVVPDSALQYALESQGLRLLAWDSQLRRHLGEMLDLEGEDAPLKDRAERMRLLVEAKEMCLNARQLPDGYDGEALWALLGQQVTFDAREKWRAAKHLREHPDKAGNLITQLEAAGRRDVRWLGTTLDLVRKGIREGECNSLADVGLIALARREEHPSLSVIEYAAALLTGVPWPKGPPASDEIEKVPWAIAMHLHSLESDGRWKDAEAMARRWTQITPELAKPWLRLARSLTALGHLSAAVDAIHEAGQCPDHSAETWLEIGLEYFTILAFVEAERAIRNAITLNEESLDSWTLLSALLIILGRWDEAREAAERAVAAATRSPSGNKTPRLGLARAILMTTYAQDARWHDAWPILGALANAPDDAAIDPLWHYAMITMRLAVTSEQSAAALTCLDSTALADRWRPLREALAAIVAGTRAVLTRLAPEIREPALQLIDDLAPDLPG